MFNLYSCEEMLANTEYSIQLGGSVFFLAVWVQMLRMCTLRACMYVTHPRLSTGLHVCNIIMPLSVCYCKLDVHPYFLARAILVHASF